MDKISKFSNPLGVYSVTKDDFSQIYSYENGLFIKGKGSRKSLAIFLQKFGLKLGLNRRSLIIVKDRLAQPKSKTITMILHHTNCDTRYKLTVNKHQINNKAAFDFNLYANSYSCSWFVF